MPNYNDLDLNKWKDYTDIVTDSLWIIPKRDNSGVHSGHYHGNFVPQIPHQLFLRYTKKGEWILDPFMGSGTSLIEAQRLGRNSIGIELQKNIAEEAYNRIKNEPKNNCVFQIFCHDSQTVDFKAITESLNIPSVQFVIMHPPYWDIIKFSNDTNDLSNIDTLPKFLYKFGKIVDNTTSILDKNRYCAVVIGDKYANSQVIPLGFYVMNTFLNRKFLLKAIIVKNFEETKGKFQQQGIWRYRALANDFYIFKHEYIMIFKKIQ